MSNQITAKNLTDLFAKWDAMEGEDKPMIYNGKGKPTVKLTTEVFKTTLRSASGNGRKALPDGKWNELMLKYGRGDWQASRRTGIGHHH